MHIKPFAAAELNFIHTARLNLKNVKDSSTENLNEAVKILYQQVMSKSPYAPGAVFGLIQSL